MKKIDKDLIFKFIQVQTPPVTPIILSFRHPSHWDCQCSSPLSLSIQMWHRNLFACFRLDHIISITPRYPNPGSFLNKVWWYLEVLKSLSKHVIYGIYIFIQEKQRPSTEGNYVSLQVVAASELLRKQWPAAY